MLKKKEKRNAAEIIQSLSIMPHTAPPDVNTYMTMVDLSNLRY